MMPSLKTYCADVVIALKSRNETIAVAESSSGGLISASLLATPGASSYYLGGSVIYTLDARRLLLNIPDEILQCMAPLSNNYVIQCAQSMRENLNATWGMAEIGVAGPTGSRYGHAPGVCALAVVGPITLTRQIETGSRDRETNMWRFVEAGCALLHEAITKASKL